MIEIGLCCDEGYAMPCGVCVTSIFESNKANKIRVHILTNGFSDESVRRFEETAKKYGQIIEIYNIDISLADGIEIRNHVTVMAYARMLFTRVLDESISKLLYLDCDIVVAGDIIDLWDTDVNGRACMAVVDGCMHNNQWMQSKSKENGHPYVNSGVLLMNMESWRANDWSKMCIEYATNHPEKFRFNDQDAINDIINKNIGILHPKYNFQTRFQLRHPSLLFSDEYTISTFEEARKSPVIIHYSSNIKPWHKEYFQSYKSTFDRLLKCSAWSDYQKTYKKYKGAKLVVYYIRESIRAVKNRAVKLFM